MYKRQELKYKYPDLDLVVLIASVRNTNRMNYIMEKYHPDIIYHAAAHKLSLIHICMCFKHYTIMASFY